MPTILNCALHTTPEPLQQGTPGDLTFVLNNPGGAAVNITSISFVIPVGTTGKTLITDTSVTQITRPDKWNVQLQGATFVATPTTAPFEVKGDGLVFTFTGMKINSQPGHVAIKVIVAAVKSGVTSTDEVLVYADKFPKGFTLTQLSALPKYPFPGDTVVLSWIGGEGASYDLTYAPDGTPKTLRNVSRTGGLEIKDLMKPGLMEFSLSATVPVPGDQPMVVDRDTRVTVQPRAPKITSFTGTATENGSITLSWTTTDCSYCKVSGSPTRYDPAGTLIPFVPTSLAYTLTPYDVNERAGESVIRRFHLAEGGEITVDPTRVVDRIVVSRSGERIVVTHPEVNKVSVIDAATQTVRAVSVGNKPVALAAGPDGVYVSCMDRTVWRCNTTLYQGTQVFSGTEDLRGIAVGTNSAYAAVASEAVLVFDTRTTPWTATRVPLTHGAADVVLVPGKNWLIVAGNKQRGRGAMSILDTTPSAGMATLFTTELRTNAQRCAVNPDSTRLLVSGAEMFVGAVIALDITTNPPTILKTLAAGGSNAAIAFNSGLAYCVCETSMDISVIDPVTGTLIETITTQTARGPRDIAALATGQRLLMPVPGSGNIATMQPGGSAAVSSLHVAPDDSGIWREFATAE